MKPGIFLDIVEEIKQEVIFKGNPMPNFVTVDCSKYEHKKFAIDLLTKEGILMAGNKNFCYQCSTEGFSVNRYIKEHKHFADIVFNVPVYK